MGFLPVAVALPAWDLNFATTPEPQMPLAVPLLCFRSAQERRGRMMRIAKLSTPTDRADEPRPLAEVLMMQAKVVSVKGT
jgi:hypothetical protein